MEAGDHICFLFPSSYYWDSDSQVVGCAFGQNLDSHAALSTPHNFSSKKRFYRIWNHNHLFLSHLLSNYLCRWYLLPFPTIYGPYVVNCYQIEIYCHKLQIITSIPPHNSLLAISKAICRPGVICHALTVIVPWNLQLPGVQRSNHNTRSITL